MSIMELCVYITVRGLLIISYMSGPWSVLFHYWNILSLSDIERPSVFDVGTMFRKEELE